MSGKPPHIHLSFILALDPDKQFLLHYVKEKLVSDLWTSNSNTHRPAMASEVG